MNFFKNSEIENLRPASKRRCRSDDANPQIFGKLYKITFGLHTDQQGVDKGGSQTNL